MRYVAFRVDHGALVENRIDFGLYEVRGQRESDLNWPRLGLFGSEAEALEKALALREEHGKKGWCPVYNPSGYGYRDVNPVLA